MAQTHEGAMKAAAARADVPLAEYLSRIDAGEKWCIGHREWHSRSDFGREAGRYDGLTPSCRNYRQERYRETYQPRGRTTIRGRNFVPARDGDRRQARRRINYFVDAGIIPDPNDLPCADCGHAWEPGGKRHEYDHYLGYAASHHEDVVPLCSTCHHARERLRSEYGE